ncbi:MAG: type II toxin-antitoxin system HicB family antitoxin [Deltaproteobacteria bacterium]|jgi:predicted HicB family RNase H-like nuclease|nr:type II toxin-antitoxin system HicB family antitoxin [Deltaproteobacteria bacterium]
MSILTYKGYQGRFEYDPDADIFHGDVLHIADVVTFKGRSIDELKTALADSIEDYFDLCKEVGKAPQKPFSGRFNVRLTPELHQKAAHTAATEGISLNNWIAHAVERAVAGQHA